MLKHADGDGGFPYVMHIYQCWQAFLMDQGWREDVDLSTGKRKQPKLKEELKGIVEAMIRHG